MTCSPEAGNRESAHRDDPRDTMEFSNQPQRGDTLTRPFLVRVLASASNDGSDRPLDSVIGGAVHNGFQAPDNSDRSSPPPPPLVGLIELRALTTRPQRR